MQIIIEKYKNWNLGIRKFEFLNVLEYRIDILWIRICILIYPKTKKGEAK